MHEALILIKALLLLNFILQSWSRFHTVMYIYNIDIWYVKSCHMHLKSRYKWIFTQKSICINMLFDFMTNLIFLPSQKHIEKVILTICGMYYLLFPFPLLASHFKQKVIYLSECEEKGLHWKTKLTQPHGSIVSWVSKQSF